jgi:hypothetical protein
VVAHHAMGIHFVFWLPECDEEFCTLSTGKLIVKKFKEVTEQIAQDYEVKHHKIRKTGYDITNNEAIELFEDVFEVNVDGDIKARFFRTGRCFDVEFLKIAEKS